MCVVYRAFLICLSVINKVINETVEDFIYHSGERVCWCMDAMGLTKNPVESMGLSKSRPAMSQDRQINHTDQETVLHNRSRRHEAYKETFESDQEAIASRVKQKQSDQQIKNVFATWMLWLFFIFVVVMVAASFVWQSPATRNQATSFLEGPHEEEPMIRVSYSQSQE